MTRTWGVVVVLALLAGPARAQQTPRQEEQLAELRARLARVEEQLDRLLARLGAPSAGPSAVGADAPPGPGEPRFLLEPLAVTNHERVVFARVRRWSPELGRWISHSFVVERGGAIGKPVLADERRVDLGTGAKVLRMSALEGVGKFGQTLIVHVVQVRWPDGQSQLLEVGRRYPVPVRRWF
ncbi:MAG: hypothetical protein AB7N76_00350 [Planctomycetota bacterium]